MDICTIIRKINWYRVGDYITFLLPWILAIGLMVGCSSIKEIPINTIEKVVYKDTTIFVRDTIKIEIPKEVVKEIVPQDTTSILRTSVALSEAKIYNGSLYHRLEQKGAIKSQIDTVITVQYVDRIIEKEVPVEVQIEKKYIPQWCWYCLMFNIIVLLIVIFKIYLRFFKK